MYDLPPLFFEGPLEILQLEGIYAVWISRVGDAECLAPQVLTSLI